MSVREYIGARYIPLFSDPLEWDSTLSYEPLTVVKTQGSSYVSRQYVPEGVAITNENYWILWADFNAQVEQYRQEVRQFDGRITANADAISAETSARQTADAALEDSISAESAARTTADSALENSISAETAARTSADSALEESIDAVNLRQSCILMLGDSYAQGVHSASATENGQNWQDMLISRLGLTDVYKYKAGSAGFISTSTNTGGSSSTVPTGTTYGEVLRYAYEYISGLGRAGDVRHVLIQGGVNDASQSDLSDLTSAVRTAVANLHSWFPNAIIHLVYCSCGSTTWQSNEKRRYMAPHSWKLGAIAGGATYDQFTNAPWVRGSSASYDGSHPTQATQDLIAGFMAGVLAGNAEDLSVMHTDENLYMYVTPDHYLDYAPNVSVAPFSSSDWSVTAQPFIFPENVKRVFGGSNFDTALPFTGADGKQYIGIFRFYVDGRIRWLDKGGIYTGNTIQNLNLGSVRIPIGVC